MVKARAVLMDLFYFVMPSAPAQQIHHLGVDLDPSSLPFRYLINSTKYIGERKEFLRVIDLQDSKSASLLIRDSPPHYLFWGAGQIRVAMSDDPNTWPNEGDLFITPRADMFDSLGVESGPPPLKLSTGDYLFMYVVGAVVAYCSLPF